jgi:hypothetical protein
MKWNIGVLRLHFDKETKHRSKLNAKRSHFWLKLACDQTQMPSSGLRQRQKLRRARQSQSRILNFQAIANF